jgi:hypothetical protein
MEDGSVILTVSQVLALAAIMFVVGAFAVIVAEVLVRPNYAKECPTCGEIVSFDDIIH